MSIASYQVQAAIHQALWSHAELTDLLARPDANKGVYDAVPEGAEYPYVRIGGGDRETNRPSSMTTAGRELTVHVHIWSRSKGFGEAKLIGAIVAERLSPTSGIGYALNLTPWDWEGTLFTDAQWLDDPDGLTRHGVLQFRVRCRRVAA